MNQSAPHLTVNDWLVRIEAILATLTLIVFVILILSDAYKWAIVPAAVGSAILIGVKELCSTFALDPRWKVKQEKWLAATAAGCSLFAVVLGAPAVAATIIALTEK